MPSSATTRLRLEKQFTGENVNTWGERLNTNFELLDQAIAGMVTVALTADVSLTSVNYATDQARYGALKFTGTGSFTVTSPAVSKLYVVWNACTGSVTMTTGAGSTVAVLAGEATFLLCDGTNFKRVSVENFGGRELTNIGTPTASTSAATKAYVDLQAWEVSDANLPGQAGAAGKFLQTDGTTPDWVQPEVADISDYASDQTTRHADTLSDATDIAAAFAVAL